MKCMWLPGLALLSACTLAGQNTADRWYYFQADGAVAVLGYDLVSYFEDGPTMGSERFQASHEGLIYQFSSDDNRERFIADPDRYLPVCGGWDAFMCGVNAQAAGFGQSRFPSDPTEYLIHNDRLYLFSANSWGYTRQFFQQGDTEGIVERAEEFWASREALAQRIGRKPAGMNRGAPMEIALWAPFLGEWHCRVEFRNQNGEYVSGQKARWRWGFGFEGYTIEDHWLPPQRISSGPAFRYWDSLNQEFVMLYIPIASPRNQVWLMRGEQDDEGNMHGEFEGVDGNGAFDQRIHFGQITDSTFVWSADRSRDEGATWNEGFMRTACHR